MQVPHFLKTTFIPAQLVIALLAGSCSSTKKVAQTHEKEADSLPALPLSEIDIPCLMYAPPVMAKIEKMVPKEFTSDAWPNYIQPSCDFRYKYRFDRSPLSISCVNNHITVQFTGNYQVAGSRCLCSVNKPVTPWLSGSCGYGKENLRRITISIGSQLSLTPDYKIRTKTQLDRAVALDKCEVSVFSSDITALIVDSVRSSVLSFCGTLDQTIAGMSLTKLQQQGAQAAYQKTALGKYGFIQVNPTDIRIGQLNYAKDSFRISVGLSCRPSLSSDSANHAADPPLPPLRQLESRDGLSLYLDANYDYSFLSKMLHDTLYNKVFEVQGRTVVIKNIELTGTSDRQIGIRIDFAGTNKGSIYLHGTPQLDTARQTLSVPDLDYTLESKDLVLKLARAFFKNKIRSGLEGKSYLDIAGLVRSNLTNMNASLNRNLPNQLVSRGQIEDIRVIGLMARPQGLQVQFHLKGHLSLESSGIL